jgi:hypothetical protein
MLSEDGCMVVAEVNARFGFSTLLFGCLYQEQCFDVLLDRIDASPTSVKERIVIVKRKGIMGKNYQGLKSRSSLIDFYNGHADEFATYFCGETTTHRYEYGSFIGMAGARFDDTTKREVLMSVAEQLYLW